VDTYGQGGIVNFPGVERGSYVPSDTPELWTDTEIRVVVPEGARNGLLDLEIPGGADLILACDERRELFMSASDPVEFVGGETHIVHFSVDASPDICLAPGATVRLFWKVCNADRVSLEVLRLPEEIREDTISLVEPGASRPGTYTVRSNYPEDTILKLRLEVSGPCGNDFAEHMINVRRGVSGPDPFIDGTFENFHRNITREDIRVASPPTLLDLLNAIEVAEAGGQRVGVKGGGCSYNDFIVPRATTNLMIDTDRLNKTSLDESLGLPDEVPRELRHVIPEALRPDLGDGHSVMSSDVLASYREFITVSPLRDRLVHVEAGIRFDRLVCLLERVGLTMPTLGGGKRHSVTGAISTGTHGATTRLPPIADFIRAIHLVGTGGQQWWLEPASKQITDPEQMRRLKLEGKLDPCLKVRYRDDLFYAALVSFGTAGIFYSVVIETINQHRFRVRTTQTEWREAQATLRERVIEPATPSDWYFEITMDPLGRARLTTLNLTNEELTSDPPHHDVRDEIRSFLRRLLPRLIAAITLGWPLILACIVWRSRLRPRRIWREIRETLGIVRDIIRIIRDLVDAIVDPSREEGMQLLVDVLNLAWRLGPCVGVGRTIVEGIQNIIADTQRPSGTWVGEDHRALTVSWGRCPEWPMVDEVLVPVLPEPQDFSDTRAFDRFFRSSEYAVPVDDTIAFTNAIMEEVARPVRESRDALVLQINLRFTRGTAALVGMQQFDRTCHVELYTIRGLNGNAEFDRRLEPVLERFAAVPHWGQLHNPRTVASRFGRTRLEAWQQAIDALASDSATPNTFRHDFALNRGLLVDL
jgi:hypothetical protein